MKTDLKQLSVEELIRFVKSLDQQPFRARQIINWMYKKFVASIDEMTDLSKDFRTELKSKAFISILKLSREQVSKDGTQKFLFELEDGETVESVLMPNSKGHACYTLCISSQVGCAAGCKFCMTGSLGLKRNLQAKEIADQVITVKRLLQQKSYSSSHPALSGRTDAAPKITNIVFMGMGEPFHNYREVHSSILKLTDLSGFSKRKITVSTSGIIPGIKKFAKSRPMVNLAISLNATTDSIRSDLMPVNRRYPLKQLIRACRECSLPPNRRITFEYVMLDNINDSAEDAHRLVRLLKGINSKVNLIPFNASCYPSGLNPPSGDDILIFQNILKKAGIAAMIRKSMGADIDGACGQLMAAYGRTSVIETANH